MDTPSKAHWDKVYSTKKPEQMSWTQAVPETSLGFIHSFNLPKSARIIDIGGGDSHLVDCLLDEGYENITVLDISAQALERAKQRLGKKAGKVRWVVSDITEFRPDVVYDAWHDRAAFHFLVTPKQVSAYMKVARTAVTGFLIIGTFSEKGPQKCSGLPVKRYSENELSTEVHQGFDKIRCINEDHITPFNTTQHFLVCSFRRQPR